MANVTYPADSSDSAALDLNRKQARLIRWQRVSMLLLMGALSITFARVQSETCRMDIADIPETQGVEIAPRTNAAGKYYKTTLIGEDGSRTPLEGKSIHIEQGGGRLLEVFLGRQHDNWLLAWAPARRDDEYFNWPSFRPYCSNQFAIEMDRVENKGDNGKHVAYDAPVAIHDLDGSGENHFAPTEPLPALPQNAVADGPKPGDAASGYYKTTLIGEDGSRTPLEGKLIEIEPGEGRPLEIYLQQWSDNSLLVFARQERNSKYFNWPVIRPGAANLFFIQMDRLERQSNLSPRAAFDAPH